MSVLETLGTPAFNAEHQTPLKPEEVRVRVCGLVREEKIFTFDDLRKMPFSRVNARLTSVSGWSVRADWEGILWADFLKQFELKPEANHAIFRSPGGYDTAVPFEDLSNPRVLIAYSVGGEPLEHRYGGPVRTVIPNLWGYKSCKWLTEIEFTDSYVDGYWESRGYSSEGFIEPGWTMDVNSKQRRQIKGGEVTEF